MDPVKWATMGKLLYDLEDVLEEAMPTKIVYAGNDKHYVGFFISDDDFDNLRNLMDELGFQLHPRDRNKLWWTATKHDEPFDNPDA